MEETDKAWLAGLFDGEGCVWCRWPTRPNVICEIKMTDYQTVKRVGDLVGGRIVLGQLSPPSKKRQWRWSIDTLGSVRFLTLILPYLVTKREEARVAILLCERPAHPERDRLAARLKEMHS